ncbi:MAG: hypothetical protein C0621_00965 [Desulfuromonas sp.]|nr:MAG: hypothetical protein C0621_00965 [Desulfuromonas sp.]
MTIMSFFLLIILLLISFLTFSWLNPQELTVFYLPNESFTSSVAMVLVGALAAGLLLGFLAHLYGSFGRIVKGWRSERQGKRGKEVQANYREGISRLLSGDLKQAQKMLRRALDKDPSRVDIYLALANVPLQEGNPAESLALLRKAREIDGKSLELLFKLATTYDEAGEQGNAEQTYRDILALDPGNRKALRSLRDLKMVQEAWSEALEVQKQVLKVSGNDRQEQENKILFHLRYEVARIALDNGEKEKAISSLREIVKQAPDFVPGRVSLGDALQASQKLEEAIKIWQEAYNTLGKSVFLARLEDLCMGAEDPESLLAFYRDNSAKRPDDLLLRFFFGKFCLRLEMVEEAMEHLQSLEGAGIDTPQLHLLLAEGHRRRHRHDDAIREYKKALGVNARLVLGYVCDSCDEEVAEWQSRCPSCGAWGSFSLADRQTIQQAKPMELRAIHHGEREAWKQA